MSKAETHTLYYRFSIETFGNKRNVKEVREMLSTTFSKTLAAKVKNFDFCQKINKKAVPKNFFKKCAIRNGEDKIMQIFAKK